MMVGFAISNFHLFAFWFSRITIAAAVVVSKRKAKQIITDSVAETFVIYTLASQPLNYFSRNVCEHAFIAQPKRTRSPAANHHDDDDDSAIPYFPTILNYFENTQIK